MTESCVIRIATQEDATRVAPLAQRTFLDAFAASNDPDDIHAYVEEALSVGKMSKELSEAGSVFFVAESRVDGALLGYAKLRPGSDGTEGIGPMPVELQRIYVDAVAIGKGIGAALMKRCLEQAQEEGYQTMWLGVWEKNHQALDFYRKWGFKVIGEHVFRLGSDDQIDLVMERAV